MASTGSVERAEPLRPYLLVPGAVGERRRRFWYSGGVTINQGQTSAVVGVVWTHWLAAHQIPAPTGDYDFQYALDLFHDAQRAGERPEDDNAGAQLLDGVAVMFSRGLIEACYRCKTIDDVCDALLVNGPVIAAVEWRESMFQPHRVKGQSVCRVEQKSPVVGGHALLFDGIDLDLELGGATGFIRFKNSWGSDWGSGGSCLISISDVETLIGGSHQPEVFYPTPVGGPPETPEDPDGNELPIAAPTPGKAPEQPPLEPEPVPEAAHAVVYEEQAIGNDRYTILDTIGYASYATAIADGILHPDTRPPLSIGIKAPWGAGKTSLMRMVRHRLEWPKTWATTAVDAKPRTITCLGSGRSLTYWSLLRALRRHRPTAPDSGADHPTLTDTLRHHARKEMGDGWRPTVWFNPWMYQTGEQVWAGFAQEIIHEITERLDARDRELFWLNLNLSRVDEQAVRHKVYALVFERLLPWLLGAIVLLGIGIVSFVAGASPKAASFLTAAGPATFVVTATVSSIRTLNTSVGGPLRGILHPANAATAMAKQGWAGTFDEVVRDPGYASRSGSFHVTLHDLREVIKLVATDEAPLVIFVDDLDRCLPGTVLQVIEAINLFLAGDFQRAIFVIAIEPDMVAAHIEVSYSALVENLNASAGTRRDRDTLGWQFLEKFIQLPLTLPPLEPDTAEQLIRSQFGPAAPPTATPGPAPPPPGSKAESNAIFDAARQIYATQQTLGDNVTIAPAVASDSASGQALKAVVAQQLSNESLDMKKVIAYGKAHLRGNPREIKRFANVFRFLVMIARERELSPTNELEVLAKLAVLSTRWPSLHSYLVTPLTAGSAQTVLDLLENPENSTAGTPAERAAADLASLTASLTMCGFGERVIERLVDEDLRAFLSTKPDVGAFAAEWL